MPYSQIITRAFEIAWRNRALWVIGIIFAFFGGGSAGSNFNFGSSSGGPTDGVGSPTMPDWATMEALITFGVIAFLVFLVIGIISLVVQSVAHTALIEGTSLAINDTPLSWRALMSAGWRGRWKSILGLKILVGVPFFLVFVVAIGIGVASFLPLFQTLLESGDSDLSGVGDPAQLFAQFFGALACLVCIVILVSIVQWFLSLIANYAFRAMVLDKQSMGAAWSQGWQLVRARLMDNIVMSILLALLLGIMGVVVSIPLYIIFAAAAFPMIALLQNPDAISPVVLGVGGAVAALLISLIAALLSGPLMAFREAIWTLTYHYLRGREVTAPAASVAPPPPSF